MKLINNMSNSNNFRHEFSTSPNNTIVNLKLMLTLKTDLVNKLRLNLPGIERIISQPLLNRIYENSYKSNILDRLQLLLERKVQLLGQTSFLKAINSIEYGKHYVEFGHTYLNNASYGGFPQIGNYATLKLNNKYFFLSRFVRNSYLHFIMNIKHNNRDICITSRESKFVVPYPSSSVFNIRFNKRINDYLIYEYLINIGPIRRQYVLLYNTDQNIFMSIRLANSFIKFSIISDVDIHIVGFPKRILCVGYLNKKIGAYNVPTYQDKFFIDTYDITSSQFLSRIEYLGSCSKMTNVDDRWLMCVVVPPKFGPKVISIFWINPYDSSVETLGDIKLDPLQYQLVSNLLVVDRNNGQVDFVVTDSENGV